MRLVVVIALGVMLPETWVLKTASAQAVAIDGQTSDGTSSISRLRIYTTTSVAAVGQVSILQSRLQFGSAGYFQLPNYASDPSGPQAGDLYYDTANARVRLYTTQWLTLATTASASAGYHLFAPAAAQEDSGTNPSLFVNKTGASGNLAQFQVSAVNKFVVDFAGKVTTGEWGGSLISLTYGGTNANLTASAGGVVYSTSSALAISAVGTSNQVLTSNAASAPSWTTMGGAALPLKANISLGEPATYYFGAATYSTTETSIQMAMPKCVLTRLRVYVTANGVSSTTFTIRNGAVDTTAAVTFGASATGAQTWTGSVSFSDGDLLSMKVVTSATAGTPTIDWTSAEINYAFVP